MYTIIIIFHVLVSFAIIAIVLLQAGKTESGRRTLQSIKTEGGTRDVARLYLIAG